MAGTGLTARFTRYSALSLITVPVGYALLLLARHFFDVNAGLLNLIVGTVLTPPSFLLYRHLVWPGGTGRAVAKQLFSFWQTVMLGALASSVLIGAADQWLHANNAIIVLAGLTGQGVVFIGRFFWLDLVTFKRRAANQPHPAPNLGPNPDLGPDESGQTRATPVIADASPE
jgi:hypothetical protein